MICLEKLLQIIILIQLLKDLHHTSHLMERQITNSELRGMLSGVDQFLRPFCMARRNPAPKMCYQHQSLMMVLLVGFIGKTYLTLIIVRSLWLPELTHQRVFAIQLCSLHRLSQRSRVRKQRQNKENSKLLNTVRKSCRIRIGRNLLKKCSICKIKFDKIPKYILAIQKSALVDFKEIFFIQTKVVHSLRPKKEEKHTLKQLSFSVINRG